MAITYKNNVYIYNDIEGNYKIDKDIKKILFIDYSGKILFEENYEKLFWHNNKYVVYKYLDKIYLTDFKNKVELKNNIYGNFYDIGRNYIAFIDYDKEVAVIYNKYNLSEKKRIKTKIFINNKENGFLCINDKYVNIYDTNLTLIDKFSLNYKYDIYSRGNNIFFSKRKLLFFNIYKTIFYKHSNLIKQLLKKEIKGLKNIIKIDYYTDYLIILYKINTCKNKLMVYDKNENLVFFDYTSSIEYIYINNYLIYDGNIYDLKNKYQYYGEFKTNDYLGNYKKTFYFLTTQALIKLELLDIVYKYNIEGKLTLSSSKEKIIYTNNNIYFLIYNYRKKEYQLYDKDLNLIWNYSTNEIISFYFEFINDNINIYAAK